MMSNILLKNGTILTMDKDNNIIENGYVKIVDGKIAELGLMKDFDDVFFDPLYIFSPLFYRFEL